MMTILVSNAGPTEPMRFFHADATSAPGNEKLTLPHQTPSPSSVLLQRIFGELDARLSALQAARDALSSLVVQARPELQSDMPQATSEEYVAEAGLVRTGTQTAGQPIRRRGRPKGSRNRFPSAARIMKAPEPRALASVIPSRPVVVSAAELAKKREAAQLQPQPGPEMKLAFDGTLEALIREVEERRTAA